MIGSRRSALVLPLVVITAMAVCLPARSAGCADWEGRLNESDFWSDAAPRNWRYKGIVDTVFTSWQDEDFVECRDTGLNGKMVCGKRLWSSGIGYQRPSYVYDKSGNEFPVEHVSGSEVIRITCAELAPTRVAIARESTLSATVEGIPVKTREVKTISYELVLPNF